MSLSPHFYALTRLRLNFALEAKGYGLLQRDGLMFRATNEVVDAAVAATGVQPPVTAGGNIIAAILAFLSSAAGQALIAEIIALITGASAPVAGLAESFQPPAVVPLTWKLLAAAIVKLPLAVQAGQAVVYPPVRCPARDPVPILALDNDPILGPILTTGKAPAGA